MLLRRGARCVYAVDVGYGQLDWRLRNDPRVRVLERQNARSLTRAEIPEPVEAGGRRCELHLAPAGAAGSTRPGDGRCAWLVALIKPQFEVGKGQVGKGGVVRDPALHQAVCDDIARWLADEQGWRVLGIVESPITGPKGNREFLIAARRS